MTKINKPTLAEAISELIKLERKYKSLKKAPIEDRDRMTALALSTGGFEALADKDYMYLDYLIELSQEHQDAYFHGNETKLRDLKEKLTWFSNILLINYSESFSKAKRTQQKYAAIYVEVEKYRSRNPKAKIKHATDAVAEKLDLNPIFVHTRYYEFRKKSGDMSIDEVIKNFQLPVT